MWVGCSGLTLADFLKFERQINLVIYKVARSVPRHDQEDLRQEARIALMTANVELNEKIAYDIARKRIIDMLRKIPPPADDITDPAVCRRVEKKYFQAPDEYVRLDSATAAKALMSLPEPYRLVLQSLFGVGHREHTEDELAEIFGRSRDWVVRQKRHGLKLLRDIME
jgi:RNA polymerase sigma factor (sigma-70 family)